MRVAVRRRRAFRGLVWSPDGRYLAVENSFVFEAEPGPRDDEPRSDLFVFRADERAAWRVTRSGVAENPSWETAR